MAPDSGGRVTGEPHNRSDLQEGHFDTLHRATAGSSKGEYHKTKHGFEILELLDPLAVEKKSRFAAALFAMLRTKLA